ncbi:hypothetical protein ACWGEU_02360 [Streptomyces goshikiensis]
MRTALRTSIVTAALAGAMLVPAAGSAFAAPAPQAVTSTKAAAQDDRYAGQAVSIGNGMVAVLRNQAEGPEAWIRAVGPQWKPGDDYMSRVLTTLNRQQTTAAVAAVSLKLTKADTAEPVLVVTEGGASKSYPLPKGKAAAPAPSENDRYAGQAVSIGNGMVAVLRNQAEGPEAWIRAVGPQWKPGDPYMFHVLAMLNRQQTTDSAFGASFKLTKAETTAPVLVVTIDGVAKSYPLPKGKAGQTCAADSKIQDIGAGTTAELYMSSNGPKVVLRSSGSDTSWRILDRGFPALNKSDGIIARIVNPSGSKPVFEWQTQGGGTPLGRTSFPSLPTGCELNYKVTEEQTGSAKPAAKPSSATTGVTTQTQAQTPVQAQTAVVPKGSVAAGAELPVETVADTDDSTTLAAGAGLFAIVAALGASVLRRRRNHG